MRYPGDDLLEFRALKELLGRYVASPLGRAALDALDPCSDREKLEAELDETREAMEYLKAAAQPQPCDFFLNRPAWLCSGNPAASNAIAGNRHTRRRNIGAPSKT